MSERVFFLIIGITCLAAGISRAADCPACLNMKTELAALLKDQGETAQLLEQNRLMLSSVSASDTSKKVKLTSNIFILSAKAETLSNHALIKQQEIEKVGCKQCPTQ